MPRLLALLSAFALCATAAAQDADALAAQQARIRAEFGEVPQRSIAAFRAAPPAIVFDARSPEEYAVSHLRGAINTPRIEQALAALDGHPRATPVVVYCSVGWRAARLARELRQRGYTQVANLDGALFAWANRGLPVYRDGQAVRDVHPGSLRAAPLLAPALRATTPR